MDIVTDLSSRAVSFLSAYQDICKLAKISASLNLEVVPQNVHKLGNINSDCTKFKEIRKLIHELFWKSRTSDKDMLSDFGKKIIDLVAQMEYAKENLIDTHYLIQNENDSSYANTPYFWRKCFKAYLYADLDYRETLVETLEYLPLLVILALDNNNSSAYERRLYQVWGKGKWKLIKATVKNKFLVAQKATTTDEYTYSRWWEKDFLPNSETEKDLKLKKEELAIHLLKNDEELLGLLKLKNVALPFETLYKDELAEISKLQKKETEDQGNKDYVLWPYPNIPSDEESKDPLVLASQMQLAGIALSGGGIRSATFNLGVLQKLAELGGLHRFDYLSTVSGGGYIGSWLVSWIHRTESIAKVSNRLNPQLSADPMSDEVRPIRWLRMYSNYLSPNTGIMSGDSWTVGMTWIRNAIINLSVLFLLLCSALSGVECIFQLWLHLVEYLENYKPNYLLICSAVLLLIGALFTGAAMRTFDKDDPVPSRWKFGSNKWLPLSLIVWAIVVSFITSIWLRSSLTAGRTHKDYFNLLLPIAVSAFLAMLIIAVVGKYDTKKKGKGRKSLWLYIGLSSIAATAAGTYCLMWVWKILIEICNWQEGEKYFFIASVPLILETISICVVVRMALMGNLFPDDRREWWGRIGGVIHRLILIWIVIAVCGLVLSQYIIDMVVSGNLKEYLPIGLASWTALIGTAVRLAFKAPKTPDNAVKQGYSVTEVFIRFAPYLFMIGFLLLGSSAFEAMKEWIIPSASKTIDNLPKDWPKKFIMYSVLSLLLFGVTCLASWRIGVNEFSLHHFYKNRLVRAYLGATRRRVDRERSSNRFTGFDGFDDVKISKISSDEGYNGPYPIINTCLNATTVSSLDRQDRKAESFIFSPLYCGFDFSTNRSAGDTQNGVFQYGYRQTDSYSEDGGPSLGSAMAISGAAVSPNMGYHSSAPTAFLLTIFNVRLGKWIGNPRLSKWRNSDPGTGLAYIIKDMIGKSDIENDYVCLSDGGHFDNMGLYELIRRKCTYILLCDAEEDPAQSCEGLANAIRRCRIDYGVEINIDTSKITDKDKDTTYGKEHIVKGSIWYPGDKKPSGKLIYIKTALTGNEEVDIRQYHAQNNEFPQQSTGDQFFDESQFESYRKLGYHSINSLNQLK